MWTRLERLKELIERLRTLGIQIRYLDLGGGLGIQYHDEEPPHPQEYGQKLLEHLKGLDCTLILEPGRVLVGNAGILVTKVLYTKATDAKHFIIVDAGMNDLARPSLYGSYHGLWPVVEADRPQVKASIVGPICESGDFLAKDRLMPAFAAGGNAGGLERRGLRLFHEFQLQRPAPGARNLGAGSGFLCYQKKGDIPPAYLGGVDPGVFEIKVSRLSLDG